MAATRILRFVAPAIVISFSAVVLVRLIGPIRFFQDDWTFISYRHSWTFDSVFQPHNGHPSVLPAMSYLFGLYTFGLHDLRYYKLVLLSAHLGVCYFLAKRAWRSHGPGIALGAWFIMCFLGEGAENFLWIFQVSLVASVFFFLVALESLQKFRETDRRLYAVATSAAVLASLMCSSVGAAAAAAITGAIVLGRRPRKEWWIPIVPAITFVVWYLGVRPATPSTRARDLGTIWAFIEAGIRTSAGAIVGGQEILGVIAFVGLLVLVVRFIPLYRRESHRLAGLMFVLSFWLLTAWARADLYVNIVNIPSPMRFRYIAAAGLICTAVDLVPPLREMRRAALVGAVLVCVMAAFSVSAGWDRLIDVRNGMARKAVQTAALVSIVDAHPTLVASETPLWKVMENTIATVDGYLETAQSAGTTAGLTRDELLRLPNGLKRPAEGLLLTLLTASRAPGGDCAVTSSQVISTLALEPGDSVVVEARAGTRLTVSRLIPPSAGGGRSLPLERGSNLISVPWDELGPPWTLRFDKSVREMTCPTASK